MKMGTARVQAGIVTGGVFVRMSFGAQVNLEVNLELADMVGVYRGGSRWTGALFEAATDVDEVVVLANV